MLWKGSTEEGSAKVPSATLSENFDPRVRHSTLRSKFSCRLASGTFAEPSEGTSEKRPFEKRIMPGSEECLKTVSVLALAFLVVYLFFDFSWAIWVSLMLLIVGLFDNPLRSFIVWFWLKFAEILGIVNSKIILSVIFYLFLTPLAFLYRVFHPALKKFFFSRSSGDSYFKDIVKDYKRDDFEKIW